MRDLVVGRVERQTQVDAQPLVGETADAVGDAAGRNRHVAHGKASHLRLKEHLHGAEDVVGIEERLAHAHEDDVVDVMPHVGFHGRKVGDDLAGREVTREALLSRGAKAAAQRAADLRGDAGGEVIAVIHQHGFDELAVVEPPQVFARAVLRHLHLRQTRQADVDQLRQLRAQRF